MERQAFARVYRIGQERPTKLCRLVVKNSIEQNMMNIKRRKDAEIDAAMRGSDEQRPLGIEDLVRLFGEVSPNTYHNRLPLTRCLTCRAR